MQRASWKTVAPLLVCLGLALPVLSYGEDDRPPGTATGEVSVNGKTVPLRHAYALSRPEGGVFILLTDVPLSAKELADGQERLRLARAGKLHAVMVPVGADKKATGTVFLHNAAGVPLERQGVGQYFPKVFDGKTVSGRLHLDTRASGGVKYRFFATFNAEVYKASGKKA
jgi:hypothetical protein